MAQIYPIYMYLCTRVKSQLAKTVMYSLLLADLTISMTLFSYLLNNFNKFFLGDHSNITIFQSYFNLGLDV